MVTIFDEKLFLKSSFAFSSKSQHACNISVRLALTWDEFVRPLLKQLES